MARRPLHERSLYVPAPRDPDLAALDLPTEPGGLDALAEAVAALVAALQSANRNLRIAMPFGDSRRIVYSNFGHPDAFIKGQFRAGYDAGRKDFETARRLAETLHAGTPGLTRAEIPMPGDITDRAPFPRDTENAWRYGE